MAQYPTDVHGPADSAPTVSNKVAICNVCGVQWQLKGTKEDNAKGCAFCGAPAAKESARGSAITIINEAPDYSGADSY